jgi:hypothetical protein
MTPVIVATHAEGVVRVWYRKPDGTLIQTGRFVAATIEPPELAVLVADLADTLHWGNGASPAPVIAALPKATDKWTCPDCGWVGPLAGKGGHIRQRHPKPKDVRTRSRAGRAVIQQRRDDVHTWLIATGPATAPQAAAVLSDLPDAVGKVGKVLDQLVARGLAVRLPATPGDATRFKAVDPNVAP